MLDRDMIHQTNMYITEWKRWHEIYKNGTNDYLYTDGMSLYLIRNHLIHFISEGAEPPESMPLPDEVDMKYMAKADEIRKRAKEEFAKFEACEQYEIIKNIKENHGDKARREEAKNILWKIESLRQDIEKDEVLEMSRSMRNVDDKIKYAKWFAKDAKKGMVGEQVSIFSIMNEVQHD